MKKRSLLSLLALAGIFLVGCQNYDDQFDQLNKKINDLQTDLDNVGDINSKIEALQEDIDDLANDDSVSDIATSVAELQSRLTALGEQLTELQNAVGEDPEVTQEDVDEINDSIEELQEQIDELLSRNAFAQGPISITNQAELAYVRSLGEFSNVRGNLTVNITDEELRDSIDVVNTILGRIQVISGGDLSLTGHASHTLDASEISFVDGNLTVATKDADLSALASVSKNVNLTYAKSYNFPNLTKTGSITLTDGTGVTQVNFPVLRAVDGSKLSTTGSTAGHATFSRATSVNLGDIEVTNLTANEATTVSLGYDGPLSGTTTITATKADASITTKITSTGTKTFTIVADDGATLDLSTLKTVNGITSLTGGTVNLSALTGAATLTINEAETITLDALTAATGTVNLPDATAVTANKLAAARAINAVKATRFSASVLALTHTVSLTKATDITIGSSSAALLEAPAVKDLTLTQLANGVTLEVDGYTKLEDLSVTGKEAATRGHNNQNNEVISDDAAKLETVTLAGFLGLVDLANNDDLNEITTSGNIRGIEINNNDDLEEITLGHSFVSGDLASTVTVTNNADLSSLNMAAVKRAKTITVQDNAKLTSIVVDTGQSTESLAEPVANLNFTVTGNKLLGSYTAARAGTETTAYVPAKAVQADLYRFKQLIKAYQGRTGGHSGNMTFNLSYDEVAGPVPGTTVAGTLIASLDADTIAQTGPGGTAPAQTDNGTNANSGINNHATIDELALLAQN